MEWLTSLYQMFGQGYEYPYTDFSQINLDFVLRALVELGEAITNLMTGKADAPRKIVYTVTEDTNNFTVSNINMNYARFYFRYKGVGSSSATITVNFRNGGGYNISVSSGTITSFVSNNSLGHFYFESTTRNAVGVLLMPGNTSTSSANFVYKTNSNVPEDWPDDQEIYSVLIRLSTTSAKFAAGSKLYIEGV